MPISEQLKVDWLRVVSAIEQLSVALVTTLEARTVAFPNSSSSIVKSWIARTGTILSSTVIITVSIVSFPDASVKVTSTITGVPISEQLKIDWLRVVSAIVQLSIALVTISVANSVASPFALSSKV